MNVSCKKIILILSVIAIQSRAETTVDVMSPIEPLPLATEKLDPEKVELGRQLFHEPKLSRNNTVSCASCHNINSSGADNLRSAIGVGGAVGPINTPTVFNSRFNFKQFWNGRAASLEEQAGGPVENPIEMGSVWKDVIAKLAVDERYKKQFLSVYKSEVPTPQQVKDAIATFEKTLVTPNSRFDRYLRGESEILTELEKSGYRKFKSFGCVSCHQGVNIGGNMFQTMGVMGNYFKDRGTPITEADLGRYNVTKDEADRFVFRVPSLRNVELTSPYFHDGSAKDLNQAVQVMVKYQLGRKLKVTDVESIVAFLKTLTGERRFNRLPASLKEAK